MNSTILYAPDFGNSSFEIVERKGRGHPDTLADKLAEILSITYSNYTKENFGQILRHQFDKLILMGGRCDIKFGGGKFRDPIRLLINGRITSSLGNTKIDFKDLLINEAKLFLESELRNFNFSTDCRIMMETTSNSTRGLMDNFGKSAINYRFHPRSLNDLPEYTNPLSNDTAVGCAYYPLSSLEKMIIEIESTLTSNELNLKFPWIGTDIKVMGSRLFDDVDLTLCVPQISTEVISRKKYKENLQIINLLIENITNQYKNFNTVNVFVNPSDDTEKDIVYLRFTGSCIESGDEGAVSRGNRINGVISSTRPFSIEGLCGKNPSYHAGKIYSVLAMELAKDIGETYATSCEVYIISQIDRLLSDPWKIIVTSPSILEKKSVENVIEQRLKNISTLTNLIVDKKYLLNKIC